jgi:CTP:molybdopterin cytidylyltransferase MocA
MGRPKALVTLGGRPLVQRAVQVLVDGGCAPLVVVVGAAAEEVRSLLPAGVHPVEAEDWSGGMGASLRAGLAAVEQLQPVPDAVLVHLVDLPGVTAAAVARLAARSGPEALVRASYGGHPAHPVLFGRTHWDGVRYSATGDAGARGYLADRPDLVLVECGDLATAEDVDTPEALARFDGG